MHGCRQRPTDQKWRRIRYSSFHWLASETNACDRRKITVNQVIIVSICLHLVLSRCKNAHRNTYTVFTQTWQKPYRHAFHAVRQLTLSTPTCQHCHQQASPLHTGIWCMLIQTLLTSPVVCLCRGQDVGLAIQGFDMRRRLTTLCKLFIKENNLILSLPNVDMFCGWIDRM